MATYRVKYGDTLFDICLNTTGSLAGINAIMDANGFTTYTPDLTPDSVIEVPDVVYNSEAVSVASQRPFSNASISASDLQSQFEEMEFLTKYDGKIVWGFRHIPNETNMDLYLSLKGNVEGFIDWGDGKGFQNVSSFLDGDHVHYVYPQYPNGDIFYVTFIGLADAISMSGLESTQTDRFRAKLRTLDISTAINVTRDKSFYLAFAGCYALIDVTGTLAGTDVVNVHQMFMGALQPISMDGFFMGCTSLTNAEACFQQSGVVSAAECFMGCTSLSSIGSCFDHCERLTDLTRAFKDCTNIHICYFACASSPNADLTDTFDGCVNITDLSYCFANSAYAFPTNYLDQFKKVTNFTLTFKGCTTTNESPYTLVNGVKVHTWQRTPDNGFAKPTAFLNCYTDSKFSNWSSIPITWGGGGIQGGKIQYGFNGTNLSGVHLTLNVFGNIRGRVDWGDGTVHTLTSANYAEHTYTQNFTDTVYVVFEGEANNMNINNQALDIMAPFQERLIRCDMRQMVNCIPSGVFAYAFKNCVNFQYQSNNFAGNTSIVDVSGMFQGCAKLNIGQGIFTACTELTRANNTFQSCNKEPMRDFYGCTKLQTANYCYDHASWTGTTSQTFWSCPALESIIGVFGGSSGNISENTFNGSKNITNFRQAFMNSTSGLESPYDTIDGVKVHLWERTPELGYTAPVTYEQCFTGAKCSDWSNIPVPWGGGAVVQTVYIEVPTWKLYMPFDNSINEYPIQLLINEIPTASNFIAYKDGTGANRLWVKGDIPASTNLKDIRFVFLSADKTEYVGGTSHLPYDMVPENNGTYGAYSNAAYLIDSKYWPSITVILDPAAEYDRGAVEGMPASAVEAVVKTPQGQTITVPPMSPSAQMVETHNINPSAFKSPVLTPDDDIVDEIISYVLLNGVDITDFYSSTIELTVIMPQGEHFKTDSLQLHPDGGAYIVIAHYIGIS